MMRQKEKNLLKLSCGIADDVFETRLKGAVAFVLEQIQLVGRDLGCNTPYKKSNPHMHIYVLWKFNATKYELISLIDERRLHNDDKESGLDSQSHGCEPLFLLAIECARRNVRICPCHVNEARATWP